VPKTGQTTSYASYDDGYYEAGVEWPTPRFTDNGDGTITDNLTELIWLKNANCFGRTWWHNALSYCNGLANGEDCGGGFLLTDGSQTGDWRLPNKRELFSLVHDGYSGPAVPDTAGTGKCTQGDPFINVLSDYYWSSTTIAGSDADAWTVRFWGGAVYGEQKDYSNYVWPVRGGQ
jgi:hypothetical protein